MITFWTIVFRWYIFLFIATSPFRHIFNFHLYITFFTIHASSYVKLRKKSLVFFWLFLLFIFLLLTFVFLNSLILFCSLLALLFSVIFFLFFCHDTSLYSPSSFTSASGVTLSKLISFF
jgi:hypothetical protein